MTPLFVVRAALRLIGERGLRKGAFHEQLARALESQRQGKLVDGEAVFDRLEAELDALDTRVA